MVQSRLTPQPTREAPSAPSGRQIWPSAIPAHAIFPPDRSEPDERWLNDLHLNVTTEPATALRS